MSRLFLTAVSRACCRLKLSRPSCGLAASDAFLGFCTSKGEAAGASTRAATASGVCRGSCAAAIDDSTQLTAKPLQAKPDLRRAAKRPGTSSIEHVPLALQAFALVILSSLIATLPSRTGICAAALLAGGGGPRVYAGALRHSILGVHHHGIAVVQSNGDIHLGSQVSSHMHGPHLDDVVLHHRHKLTARHC